MAVKKRSESRKLVFSKTRMQGLPLPEKGRVFYHDEKLPGLCVQVTAAGGKVFYVYRWLNGRPEKIRLGTFGDLTVEQARTVARAVVGDIAKGGDPVAERKQARDVATLEALFNRWGDIHASIHRRTWKEDSRVFRKYLAPFHNRQLNRITPGDIAEWHGDMGQKHGPIQANRALTLLSTVFNYSPKLGYDGPNPCKGIKRFREQSRDRFLLPAEMKRFFEAVQVQPDPWRDFFQLLLFTGARRSSLTAMRWEEIDFNAQSWRIPRPKNQTPTTIPLTPPALQILAFRYSERGDSPWVFPGRAGHVKDPRKAWQNVLKDAEIENLHLHDLRRSLGSWQAALGSSLVVIGASLGHRDLKSTQVYSRLQLGTVHQSMGKATDAMLEAANGGQDDGEA